jgi:capsular exopolysaccharide synthesis family protein
VTEKFILPPGPSGNGTNGTNGLYRLTVMQPKRHYRAYLRERWWVVLVLMALALGAVMAMETLHKDKYTSIAQLYAGGTIPLTTGNIFNDESDAFFGTQIEMLKSPRLQSEALNKAGYVAKPGTPPPVKLEVTQPLKTTLLDLRATGADPDLVQRFLAALIDQYLAYKKETRTSSSEELVNSLSDELSRKEAMLQGLQEKWLAFQKTNNIAALDAEAKSDGAYLSQLTLDMAKLQVDRDLLAAGLPPESDKLSLNNPVQNTVATDSTATNSAGMMTAGDDRQSQSIGSSRASSTTESLKSTQVQLAQKQAERARVFAEHGAMAVKGLDDTITNLAQTVSILQNQRLEEIQSDLTDADRRIEILSNSIPGWKARLLEANTRLTEGQKMQDDMKRESDYYDHLMGTMESVDLNKNVQQEQWSIFQTPTTASPVDRHLVMRMALALVFGIGAGMGLVFVWYMLDDRFVSVQDIKDQFGELVLGTIPQIKISSREAKGALLMEADPRRAYAESYRHLRSALLLNHVGENPPRTILFTSALPGEGKSTVALNLARVLARSGMRVALVDADPHGSSMDQLLGHRGQAGLSDYLRGEATPDEIIQESDIPGLSLVGTGKYREGTEGLMLQPHLPNLLERLRQNHHYVILDGPPILAADDAALLVPHAETVALVVRPFYSRSRMVRRALEMLYQRQASHVAIVYNQARPDDLAGQLYRQRNGAVKPGKVMEA